MAVRLAGDYYGNGVALSPDGLIAAVGAWQAVGTSDDQGAVHLFKVRRRTNSLAMLECYGSYFVYAAAGVGANASAGRCRPSSDPARLLEALMIALSPVCLPVLLVVMQRSGSTWSYVTKLTASDGGTDDYFSYNMALTASSTTDYNLVVGAFGAEKSSLTGAGAVRGPRWLACVCEAGPGTD